MKFALKLLLILVVVLGAVAAASRPVAQYWRARNRVQFRTAEVSRGTIVQVKNSTGTIKPVLSVQVGSFVSGPIMELHVEFNDHVKKDQLMAKIDPLIYNSNVARDEAVLATRKADVERVKAQLQLATNDERRSKELRAENQDFISQAEMDQFHFNRMQLAAQLAVAEATVKQAQGSLDYSVANLGYTDIKSPVDGVVIDRKIQPGQTIAAQFQTPELFTIAPDMEKKMHVFASVDEADIGLIKDAQSRKQPVRFTVDAYPDDLFEGEIEQVRVSSTTTQNVVTYPVVVAAPNPQLKLLPGMTASLSFQIAEKADVLRIPVAALRFYPDIRHVREEDRALLEGIDNPSRPNDPNNDDVSETKLSAMEKAAAGKARNHRHVWTVQEDGKLRAIEVVTGIDDNKFAEIISGDVKEGQEIVIGLPLLKVN